jgi:hypothetical protein
MVPHLDRRGVAQVGESQGTTRRTVVAPYLKVRTSSVVLFGLHLALVRDAHPRGSYSVSMIGSSPRRGRPSPYLDQQHAQPLR